MDKMLSEIFAQMPKESIAEVLSEQNGSTRQHLKSTCPMLQVDATLPGLQSGIS